MKENNNICIIGQNIHIDNIRKVFNLTKEQYKNWNFSNFKLKNIDDKEEFERISKNILNSLEIIISKKYSNDLNKVFSYTIIYSLNNFKENNNEKEFIKKLFQDILNPITSNYYLPFFIFLAKDIEEKDEFNKFLELDEIQKPDERNISCFIFDKENNSIENKIFKIYAFFFEKGDEFDFEDKKIELYKKPKETLFYINILTLGKTQVGKSTFINTLLKEKKAREGGEGSSVTRKQISYHVDNVPLIINDIEGFIGEETISKVTNKILLMQKNLGEKEIHLVIYIVDYYGPTYFNENEYSIFEQLASKDDITQFIFICSKSPVENDEKKVKMIQNSFFQMIKLGLEKEKKQRKNLIDVLNYLYYCQKKDINYDEIKSKIDKEKFDSMNFFEKLELKFKDYKDEERNREMTNTIIEKDKTLFFINLIIDNNHNKKFGMNKISKKIREALGYIKLNNINFLNEEIKINQEKIKTLENEINFHKKKLEENKEIINFINNNEDINTIRLNEENETQKLLDESSNLQNLNNDYKELINCIKENKICKAREYAENLRKEKMRKVEKELKWHKGLAYASGIIPLVDIYIQYKIKKNAKLTIAKKFKDNLIDFDNKDKGEDGKENDIKDIKDIKKKSNDLKSDILKTLGRVVTIGANILARTILLPIAEIGILIGVLTGGLVMEYDIKSYLDFYSKRYLYRCFVNLSFDSIEKYLIENFEKNI